METKLVSSQKRIQQLQTFIDDVINGYVQECKKIIQEKNQLIDAFKKKKNQSQ